MEHQNTDPPVNRTSIVPMVNIPTAHASKDHLLCVRNGELWGWRLGRDGFRDRCDSTELSRIGTDADWASVAGCDQFFVATKYNGSMWVFGNRIPEYIRACTIRGLAPNQPNDDTVDGHWGQLLRVMQAGWGSAAPNGWGNALIAWRWDRTLWMWRGGTQHHMPIGIGMRARWECVASGAYHTVAVRTDGTLWGWHTGHMCLGGEEPSESECNEPVQIGTEDQWVSVAVIGNRTFALGKDGVVWGWGCRSHSWDHGTPGESVGEISQGSLVLESRTPCEDVARLGVLWNCRITAGAVMAQSLIDRVVVELPTRNSEPYDRVRKLLERAAALEENARGDYYVGDFGEAGREEREAERCYAEAAAIEQGRKQVLDQDDKNRVDNVSRALAAAKERVAVAWDLQVAGKLGDVRQAAVESMAWVVVAEGLSKEQRAF